MAYFPSPSDTFNLANPTTPQQIFENANSVSPTETYAASSYGSSDTIDTSGVASTSSVGYGQLDPAEFGPAYGQQDPNEFGPGYGQLDPNEFASSSSADSGGFDWA
ncbi:hypothetical protein [Aureimonas sp. ME7]|uniref:hypothetical protein n=1 Tax=Aureimonas sp. ME7 TaxID=2744252 RepID=UPI0015FDC268|nr:hypothetical protein [Aureimonas sp. ME7]